MQEERAAITAAAEKRSALLARIAAGENVDDGNGGEGQQRVLRNFKGAAGEGDNDDKYGSMEYRKAFMKYVCRGEALPKEYRADAVSKSTDVGAVIPTTVLNQIVEKLESTGMILALVTRTAYKGGVSIPVSTVKPTATWVNEGAGSDKQKKNIAKDGMITFAYHKLRCAVAVQTQGNAQESTKGQHKAHKAYYQEVRERENHKRAVTKEYTELDGTRRTRRQL